MRAAVLALVMVAGCAPAATGPAGGPSAPAGGATAAGEDPAEPTTIWEGVYTAEQATRGERTAWLNCFSCHTAAEWGSVQFLNPSARQRLGDLYQTMRRSMPLDAPGRLSAEEYVDVLAYILQLQGAPAGVDELPSDLERLDRILVTPGGDGRQAEPSGLAERQGPGGGP